MDIFVLELRAGTVEKLKQALREAKNTPSETPLQDQRKENARRNPRQTGPMLSADTASQVYSRK